MGHDREEYTDEEDGDGEDPEDVTPLLPIFSSVHLGMLTRSTLAPLLTSYCRLPPRVPPHARHPPAHHLPLRNDPILGTAALPASLRVPPQTHPHVHTNLPLLLRVALRPHGQRSAIPQGGRHAPWNQRGE